MSVDDQLKGLHARIDEEYEAKLAQLEAERKERHEALDKVWPIIAGFTAVIFAPPVIKALAARNDPQKEGRKPFPMRRAISQIIDRLEEGAEISQPQIYDQLMGQYPELKEEPPVNMRAQIASVLNWITKNGRLQVAKEGRGSYPNVYRKPHRLDDVFPDTRPSLLGQNS